MRPATIKDVAEKAGVSITTVSHVVNNTRFVEKATSIRVLQAIEDLGYRPSMTARNLKTNRTETIGIIVPDMVNPLVGLTFQGIEEVFRPLNYNLILCNTNMIYEREEYYLDTLLRQQVEGILSIGISKRWDAFSEVDALQIPIVFATRTFKGSSYPYVGSDKISGVKLGTEHLISCGHRKIGILAGPQHVLFFQEQLVAFQEVLRKHQIPLPDEWIVTSPSEVEVIVETGRQAALQLLRLPERPTAMIIGSNMLALGTLVALKSLGLRYPEDIAILSLEEDLFSEVVNPPLTTIRPRFQYKEIGRVAAQMLISIINGWPIEKSQVYLPCELVVRQSCCMAHYQKQVSI